MGDQGAEGVPGAGGGSGGVFVWRRCVVKRRGTGAGAPEYTDSGLIDVEWDDAAGGEVRIDGWRVSYFHRIYSCHHNDENEA